jgi:hypothetical protein
MGLVLCIVLVSFTFSVFVLCLVPNVVREVTHIWWGSYCASFWFPFLSLFLFCVLSPMLYVSLVFVLCLVPNVVRVSCFCSVSCPQCCTCLLIFYSWLSVLFFLKFITLLIDYWLFYSLDLTFAPCRFYSC